MITAVWYCPFAEIETERQLAVGAVVCVQIFPKLFDRSNGGLFVNKYEPTPDESWHSIIPAVEFIGFCM